MTTRKKKNEVPPRSIVELYSEFRLPPYEKFFKVFATINHTATLEEVELAIKEISQTNKLEFVKDIKSINRGESLKDEDKRRLAETRRALKEIGYESSVFYDILFKTIETDFSRHGFVNKVCNALTATKETKKSSSLLKKSVKEPLPSTNQRVEKTEPCTIMLTVQPEFLAEKLGIATHKITKIIDETHPQLTLDESGIRVCATIPWDKV